MLKDIKFVSRIMIFSHFNLLLHRYRKKLFGWQSPELILRSGYYLVLYDILKTSTITTWLYRLENTGLVLR